jgi:hypothetical protein
MGKVMRRVLTPNGMMEIEVDLSVKKEEKPLEQSTESNLVESPKSISDMSHNELKKVCDNLGLPKSGSKQALINRILDSEEAL